MLKHYLPLAIVPLALILWGFFGATQLTAYSFSALINYQSPYKERSTPGNGRDALSPQVVVVVLEGLRLDQSRQMANLNRLRSLGADRVVRVGQPSLSLPGWAVIGTGAWQEQHGQSTNFNGRPLAFDSIFAAARRQGLTSALTGSPSWDVLFKEQIDSVRVEADPLDAYYQPDDVRRQDDAIEADALSLLKEKQPGLLLVHFAAPDRAYHGFGVFSTEGRRAVQDVDARLGRLMQALDMSRTTLIVTSDHGQIDRGGNGGPEEEVLNVALVAAGSGIRTGQYGLATQADIAPTVTVLLGASIPAENQGDVLFDMLDMPPAAQAARGVDWAQQISDRYTLIDKVIGVGTVSHPKLAEAKLALEGSDYAAALAAARAEVASTRDAAFSFREGRLQQERLMRTPAFLLMLLPFALYTWFMRRMVWEFRRPMLAALAYFVVYYALFFGRGYAFSFSMLNDDNAIPSWFAARVIDALIALAASAAVLGLLSRGEFKLWTVLNTLNGAFIIAAVLWFQICVFFWLYDFAWPWYLPDPVLGFKYFLDTLQTGAFMLKSPPLPMILLMPLIALGVQGLVDRVPNFRTP